MITIDQLLESVDLDFEPRWVTQNAFGVVAIRSGKKPHPESPKWIGEIREYQDFGKIKLAEFDGKDWTECIYEVPRTTTDSKKELVGKIELLKNRMNGSLTIPPMGNEVVEKINEIIDWINDNYKDSK